MSGRVPERGSLLGSLAQVPRRREGSSVRLWPHHASKRSMDWELARGIGSKALFAGAGALLLYWT
ncbi:MAG: hypothetical protein VKN15_04750, partial [Cyanobacteriota bacterium]|nr:hypothetical protein [Cyanobacteriota bacterium]